MKARVSNLAKTESEWSKLNFIPLIGELIVYTPDANHAYSRVKIGDGKHTLRELPFTVESIADAVLNNYNRLECFDAGRITDYF